jgi:hypothetical protein
MVCYSRTWNRSGLCLKSLGHLKFGGVTSRQMPLFIFLAIRVLRCSLSRHQHVVSLARSAIIDAALSSFLITPGSIIFVCW